MFSQVYSLVSQIGKWKIQTVTLTLSVGYQLFLRTRQIKSWSLLYVSKKEIEVITAKINKLSIRSTNIIQSSNTVIPIKQELDQSKNDGWCKIS